MPTINEADATLLDIARKFQDEYDGLRNSRAIALYLRMRNRFSKLLGKGTYEPLGLDASAPQEKIWMRLSSHENKGNWHFYDHRADAIARMPSSNGCAYYANVRRPRVGIITDEFMFDYYDGPLDLTYLYPDSYQEAIDRGNLDFMLYVTCWHGRHDQVDTYYSNNPEGHERISAVMAYARKAGLPVAFQSIEDPPSYDLYLDLAKQADFVFTSCKEKVLDYVRDLGHDRVFSCPFGVNPQLSNPVGIGLRSNLGNEFLRNSVLFAGSWYNEYPQRCADTELIFDAILETGRNLVVFDRRWPVDLSIGGMFPEKYWHYVLPGLGHKELQAVTKLFDFAVNLNSVKDSRTMCAMRTYELQAMGVIGLANDALALEAQFPELPRARTPQDVGTFFKAMDVETTQHLQLEGIRRIMDGHTVYDRLNLMFEQMGMNFRYPRARVAIMADEHDMQAWKQANDLAQSIPEARTVSMSDLSQAKECQFALVAQGHTNAASVQDALSAFKYVDVDFVNPCRTDATERFSYTEATLSDVPHAVFNLQTVDTDRLSALFRERPADTDDSSVLKGFAVPCEK